MAVSLLEPENSKSRVVDSGTYGSTVLRVAARNCRIGATEKWAMGKVTRRRAPVVPKTPETPRQ